MSTAVEGAPLLQSESRHENCWYAQLRPSSARHPGTTLRRQTLKLVLSTPRAIALPRHCAHTAVITTHQKPAESNRDDLSVELPITSGGRGTRGARAQAAYGRIRDRLHRACKSEQCCNCENPERVQGQLV